MSNIAFTTALLIVLAAPGYLVRATYFSGTFTRHLLPSTWTEDIPKAILYSVPFHLVWLWVFEKLQHAGKINHTLTFVIIGRILTGEYEGQFVEAVGKVYANGGYVVVYYGLTIVSAVAFGLMLKNIVWWCELDVAWPGAFVYKSDWLYKLLGRGQLGVPSHRILTIMDALTDQPAEVEGRNRLYTGVVSGYTLDPSGGLREIVLTKAKRGKFVKPNEAGKYEFRWEPIPGDYFILGYNNVKNLNLTYFDSDVALQDDADSPPPLAPPENEPG